MRSVLRWDWFDWMCVQVATGGLVGVVLLAATLAHGLGPPAQSPRPERGLVEWRAATPAEERAWFDQHRASR